MPNAHGVRRDLTHPNPRPQGGAGGMKPLLAALRGLLLPRPEAWSWRQSLRGQKQRQGRRRDLRDTQPMECPSPRPLLSQLWATGAKSRSLCSNSRNHRHNTFQFRELCRLALSLCAQLLSPLGLSASANANANANANRLSSAFHCHSRQRANPILMLQDL